MPKLLLRAAAYYQHQSTPQNANNRRSRRSRRPRKNIRLSNAPRMILDSFILVSDAEAEEGEGKPSPGSPCPGAENKHVVLSVGQLVVQGSLQTLRPFV